MNKSETIAKLASALVKAQAEMPKVKFDAKNPFLKNKYATLGALVEAARPVLAKHGLAVSQFPTSYESQVGVSTVLMHESGEWVEESIAVDVEVGKGLSLNQAAGVTITYLRRYAFAGILGLLSEEDNDGDDGSAAHSAVTNLMGKSRAWTTEQTEAVSTVSLDAGAPLTKEEAEDILNASVLPENATAKTVSSWFKRYLASEGKTLLDKAADANTAYIEAKKSGGK